MYYKIVKCHHPMGDDRIYCRLPEKYEFSRDLSFTRVDAFIYKNRQSNLHADFNLMPETVTYGERKEKIDMFLTMEEAYCETMRKGDERLLVCRATEEDLNNEVRDKKIAEGYKTYSL